MRAKLHAAWLEQQDSARVEALLHGVKNGFRKKRSALDDEARASALLCNRKEHRTMMPPMSRIVTLSLWAWHLKAQTADLALAAQRLAVHHGMWHNVHLHHSGSLACGSYSAHQ